MRKRAQSRVSSSAGRASYLAAFHAPRALIFERTDKVLKAHRGGHAQFARLTRDIPELGGELPRFLSRAYDFKAVADYKIGPDATVPLAEAISAIEAAENFVNRIAGLLEKTQ